MELYTDDFKEQLEQIKTEMKSAKEEKAGGEVKAAPSENFKAPEEQVDPTLAEAIKQGYDPNFKGENKKTPEQFIKDGSFFRKIEAQNKKIDELIEFQKQALEHNQKLEKAAYDKALKDIQTQKLEAIQMADVDGVLKLEQEAQLITEKKSKMEQEAAVVQAPPALTDDGLEFQNRNASWLNGTSPQDNEMREMAKAVIGFLQNTHPNMTEKEGIERIEAQLKRDYPERFENSNQKVASLTASSTAGDGSKGDDLTGRLTKQQKDFVRQAKQFGSKLTEASYAKQLDLIGELRND